MKHKIITYIILLFTSTRLLSQDTLSDNFLTNNYKEYSDATLSKLDKSKIPFGILYEKVQPLANLDFFQIENKEALTNDIHFFQAYHEFYFSHFDLQNLLTEDEIYNQLDTYEKANRFTQPLGFLFANFATIKQNAVENGLFLFEDGVFKDVASQNPYNTISSILISPLSTEDWTIGTHYIQLESNFIFGNAPKPMRKVRINFGDGLGWQERDLSSIPMTDLNKNTVNPFVYELTSIDKQIDGQIEVEFSDGTQIHSNFSQAVKKTRSECNDCIPIGGMDGGDQLHIVGDLYPSLSDYGITPTNAEGTAYIFYANQQNYNAHKLVKPVIFLDGYDPDNGRDVRRIYTKYINKNVTLPIVGNIDLADHIRALGYDLIILDFKEGGDFLEQNAMVVEKLLTTLYQSHQSTMQKDFVVIGPSMGSIVAQFALAHMASNNIPHHTRDYISFDGPHQGANVARGVTDLVEYLTWGGTMNLIAGKKLSKLRTTLYNNHAARQMLVHHPSSSNEWPTSDNERNTFLTHLNSVGTYAQNLRKVAVINGNRNGIANQNLNSCNEFTHIQLYRYQFPLFLFPGSFVNCNWSVRATTNNGRCQDGHFFTLWPLANIAGVPLGTKKFYSDINGGKRGYDYCPGSYFSAITDQDGDDAQTQILKLLNHFQSIVTVTYSNFSGVGNIGKGTFIPTISAGDITQSNLDLTQNLQNVVLAKCAGTTPFDRVYANPYSTDHVAVDNNIAQWFLNEIEETYSPLETVQTTISANTLNVCDGQTISLTTNNLPTSSTVSWIYPNTLTPVGATNGATILLQKSSGSSNGTFTIKSNSTSNCGSFHGEKPISYGIANSSTIFKGSYPNSPCGYFLTTAIHPGSQYEWSEDNFATSSITNSNEYGNYSVHDPSDTWLRIINQCGISPITYKHINGINNLSCPYKTGSLVKEQTIQQSYKITVYPNPTSNNWNIMLYNFVLTTFAEVKLFDINGNVVWKRNKTDFSNSNIEIPATNLAIGIYSLRIITDTQSQTIKLIKQ